MQDRKYLSPLRTAAVVGTRGAKRVTGMIVATTIATVGLVGAGALVSAAPAKADDSSNVTCYGDYCSGQDPEATGCAQDAQTVQWMDLSGARLELRFSPRCQTEWAKWIQYPVGFKSDLPTAIAAIQDTGYTQSLTFDVNGRPEGSNADPASPTPAATYWTGMIYSPVHTVKAVATIQCGDTTLIGAAFDCAMNGRVETPSY